VAEPFMRLNDARILVVDDEQANVDLLSAMLGRAEYRNVIPCTDAEDAIRQFSARRPDLVLLDLHMAPTDGFDVLARIQSITPREDYLPVMVLTADSSSDTRARALECGAQDFLLKPFDYVELTLRVRNLLHTRRLHCLLQRRTERLEEEVEVLRQATTSSADPLYP
jgi:putative two-component system response regulator